MEPSSDGPISYGADFLQLDPATAPRRGLTDWLVARLRTAITDARLPAGTALPPTRVLAADLGTSRGTVVEAYRRLGEEGLVTGRPGAGTVVTGSSLAGPLPRRPAGAAPPADAVAGAAAITLLRLQQAIRAAETIELDLSPGLPDLSAFPRTAWLRAERTALQNMSTADLGYGDPRGHPRLRRELVGWLGRTRGIRADADDVLVVNGVAQSLALLARLLRARGVGKLGVEDPGSRGAREEMAYWGLDVEPVPVDADGMRIDALEASGAESVLLTPAHQFPTGVVLAPQRRRELLAWAHAGKRLIVEDDYDAEHRYDRAPVPALQASAPGRVAHTGSTSKTLAPGLRLGWLVAPRPLQDALVEAKRAADLGSPALPQLVLAQLLANGELERHVRAVRTRQRTRRDALLTALTHALPNARIAGIAAGLHLLVTLPALAPGADLALAERIAEAGVLVHPLSWHRVRPGPPGFVLGYAAQPPDRLAEAVRRIAAVLSAAGTPAPAPRPGGRRRSAVRPR